jgi:hypothetical protein
MNFKIVDYQDVVNDQIVTTTWHDDEPTNEVFRISKTLAFHPAIELK